MNKISAKNKYLFNYDYFNYKDEELDARTDVAKELQKKYPWKDVFESWNGYLRDNCHTEKEIINCVNLIFIYSDSMTVPHPFDPYDFMGYLLAKVDLDKYWAECGDFFDSVALDVLNVDIVSDPYYHYWEDPKVIEAAKKYQGK
jgi:hypothetical protein